MRSTTVDAPASFVIPLVTRIHVTTRVGCHHSGDSPTPLAVCVRHLPRIARRDAGRRRAVETRMRAVVLLVLAACATEPVAHSNEPPVTSGVVIKQIPVAVNRRLDVLLVIDNSAAMAPYQERLAANVRRFVDALRATPGGLPNLRLAVTTTCDDGRLREDPA